MRAWVALWLVLCTHRAWAYTPLADLRLLHHTTDGSLQTIHRQWAQCTEGDADIVHTLEFADVTSGTVSDTRLECLAPSHITTRELAGWIPLASYAMITKVCAVAVVGNSSVLVTDTNYDPYAQSGANYPTTPSPNAERTFEPDSSNFSPNRRRLLENVIKPRRTRRHSYDLGQMLYTSSPYGTKWDVPWDHGFATESSRMFKHARRLLGQSQPTNQQTSRAATGQSAGISGQGQHAATGQIYPRYVAPVPQANAQDQTPPHGTDAQKNNHQLSAGTTMAIGMTGIALAGLAGGPFGAIAAGVGFGLMCAHHTLGFNCGGGGVPKSVATALHLIGMQIDRLDSAVNLINAFDQSQVRFDAITNNRFLEQNRFNRFAQKQINEESDAIQGLAIDVIALKNVTDVLGQEMVSQFTRAQENFELVSDTEQQIWNNTLLGFQSVEDHLQQLSSTTVHLDRLLRQTDVSLIHNYRNTYIRRQLIDAVYRMIDTTTPLASTPYLSYDGQRPKTDAEIAALETLNSAFVAAEPITMRTIQVGANYFAQRHTWKMKCSPSLSADKFVGAPSFMDLMDLMSVNAGCYPGDPDALWTCRCVVVLEYEECQIANTANVYPFAWANITELPDQGETDSLCSANVQTRTVLSGGGHVLSTREQLENALETFCAEIQADGIASADGRNLRWFGSNIPMYVDQKVAQNSADADACSSGFASSRRGNFALARQRPGYAFYNRLQKSAGITANYQVPLLEAELYGKMPSGITYWQTPFNDEAKLDQTYTCYYVGFAKTTTTKLPVYKHIRLLTQKGIRVTTNSGAQVILNGSAVANPFSWEANTAGQSRPVTGKSADSANFTIFTNVQLMDESEHILPESFFAVGEWLDPLDPLTTYDVPQDEVLPIGSRVANMGRMSYLWEGNNWPLVDANSNPNITVWQQAYQTPFDVRGLGSAPIRYKRKLVQLTPSTYVCGDMFDSDGVTLLNNTGLYDWCRILASYAVEETTANGQSLMRFTPHHYTMNFELTVPGGTAIIDQHSVCPTGIQVTRNAGLISVVLNTTSTESVSIFVVISDRARSLACTVLSQSFTTSRSNPIVQSDLPAIAGCEPLYMNFRTPHGGWCLEEPGIEVESSFNYAPAIGVPPQVMFWSRQVEDRMAQEFAVQLDSTITLMSEILDIESETLTPDIPLAVQNAIRNRANDLRNMTAGNAAIQAALARAGATIEQQAARIAADMAARRRDGASSSKIIQQINNSNVQAEMTLMIARAISGELNATNEQIQAAQAAMDRAIAQAVADILAQGSGGGDDDCGGIPLLGDIICSLLGGVSDWFKGWIGQIFTIIIVIGMCVGGCYLIRFMGNQAATQRYGPAPAPYVYQNVPRAYRGASTRGRRHHRYASDDEE